MRKHFLLVAPLFVMLACKSPAAQQPVTITTTVITNDTILPLVTQEGLTKALEVHTKKQWTGEDSTDTYFITTYDKEGRRESEVYFMNHEQSLTENFVYNADGLLVLRLTKSPWLPDTSVTEYYYNNRNLVKKVIDAYADQPEIYNMHFNSSGLEDTIWYNGNLNEVNSYNSQGQRIKLYRSIAGYTIIKHYEYNSRGLLCKETIEGRQDETTYEYMPNGLLSKTREVDSRPGKYEISTTLNQYLENFLLQQTQISNNEGTGRTHYSYTYY